MTCSKKEAYLLRGSSLTKIFTIDFEQHINNAYPSFRNNSVCKTYLGSTY